MMSACTLSLLLCIAPLPQPHLGETMGGVPASGAPMVRLPAGTVLDVRSERTLPMRVGQPIEGVLEYDVYSANQMLLPKGTLVTGQIVRLRPDRGRRIQARLRGDFTPFVTPAVQFDHLRASDGRVISIGTEITEDGAPTIHLLAAASPKGGLVRQQVQMAISSAKDRLRMITAPGKRDRLVDLLYSQLPYHPQRIEKGTSWTTTTLWSTEVQARSAAGAAVAPASPVASAPATQSSPETGAVAPEAGEPSPWIIEATLLEPMSSGHAHVGDQIRAEVAAPVLKRDQTVAVPQGSMLEGEVTQARPARRFGRAGALRFDFRRLRLPGSEQAQVVQTSLTGIDAARDQKLVLGTEGQVRPKPQDKVVVPLLLLALASRPLDRDRGDSGVGKSAVASNSLGVVGFLVGTAGGWRNVAAGIGFYGTAISVYNRWIKRGEETSFRRGTRIVVQTTPRRSSTLGQTLGASGGEAGRSVRP